MNSALHDSECSELVAAFGELFGEPDDRWVYQAVDWRPGLAAAGERTSEHRLMISPLTLPTQPERLRLPMVSQVAEHTYLIGTRLSVSASNDFEVPPIVWATVRANPATLMEH